MHQKINYYILSFTNHKTMYQLEWMVCLWQLHVPARHQRNSQYPSYHVFSTTSLHRLVFFAGVCLQFSQCPREATTQTAAAISDPSCQHVCSAAYLFYICRWPWRSCAGLASSACLRIHSHLRIKLLTLVLLVMLGPAPIFEPMNVQELGNIQNVCEGKKVETVRLTGGVFFR